MRGYQIEAYGAPGTHRLAELPEPSIGPDDVLIGVEAIGLNYPDALMVQGKYQKRPDPPFVPGRDCAGTVVAVGEAVEALEPGQRVVAQVFAGAFAERAVAPKTRVFPIPDNVDTVDAAGAITVFNTAYVAVCLRGRVKRGDRVVITGAAGGVGAAALQLCRALEAQTLAVVSSEERAQSVRALGADKVLLAPRGTGEEEIKQFFKTDVRRAWGDDEGADVVIDTVGGAVFIGGLRCLGFGGRLVIVGFASGEVPSAKANYLLYNNLAVLGAPLDIHFDKALKEIRGGTAWWLDLMASGTCRANVTHRLPFERLMEGLQALLDREAAGKQVVVLDTAG